MYNYGNNDMFNNTHWTLLTRVNVNNARYFLIDRIRIAYSGCDKKKTQYKLSRIIHSLNVHKI